MQSCGMLQRGLSHFNVMFVSLRPSVSSSWLRGTWRSSRRGRSTVLTRATPSTSTPPSTSTSSTRSTQRWELTETLKHSQPPFKFEPKFWHGSVPLCVCCVECDTSNRSCTTKMFPLRSVILLTRSYTHAQAGGRISNTSGLSRSSCESWPSVCSGRMTLHEVFLLGSTRKSVCFKGHQQISPFFFFN